jgi:phospholipid/cholesterol/gamma-HCH transport system substrate-binding protein
MNQTDERNRKKNPAPTDDELRSAIPRTQGRLEFRVGIFVILGIAGVLFALFLLTDPSTFRGRYRISTMVEEAGGIRRGDPVQMRGVNIGRVMGFDLDSEGVEITLEIEGEWDIPEDSRARLAAGGLLGGRTVEVMEGRSSTFVSGGGRIPGENATGILDMPADLGKDAKAVLGRIQSLLEEPTVDAIQGSARELQTLLAQLSVLAEEQGAEIAQLTASLNRSAAGLETAAASGEDISKAVARADSALLTVNQTSEVVLRASTALETILARMEAGEGTLGQLSTNPALYDTLLETMETVRFLVTDIKEDPKKYFSIEIF